ncbi:Hypothetical predicted protein, partial [Xyrichtys novacula]
MQTYLFFRAWCSRFALRFDQIPLVSFQQARTGCFFLLPAAPPPEDNGPPPIGAAVTGSDSQWRAERHRHQMVK